MAEPGIYALTKAILGGVSAIMTGPFGALDLPAGDLEAALASTGPGMVVELVSEQGDKMGRVDHASGGSPGEDLLNPAFIPGLIATEDARFYEHPGVDPFAVLAAISDQGGGRIRGGSSLTQQAVKNEILGNGRTLERKLIEAILSVRAVHSLGRERILDGYLSHSWFGRGTFGTVGAAYSWFGKTWSEVDLSETALLIGILKGPALYDPARNPETALARRNAVLGRMRAEGVITPEEEEAARLAPLEAPGAPGSDAADPWIEAAVLRELETGGLPASDNASATLSIDPRWQVIVQEAVSWGATRLDGTGPAGSISATLLASGDHERIRSAMAPFVDVSREVGRALVTGTDPVRVLIDRGYGSLEPENRVTAPDKVRIGEVYAYRRTASGIALIQAPRVNAAAVLMDPKTGAILATVGGANPEMSRFDRTVAHRQVGSAIKPFLWARALEAGYRFDDLVPDVESTYVTPTGEVWTPRNYDGTQTGLIPLFVALEESSNNVAARLIDQLGTGSLAEITEAAGIYPEGGMRRHPSSALGASESSLVAMAAGYAAIANGGNRVTPHTHVMITSENALMVPEQPRDVPVMTRETAGLISSMLYGVTTRGTAAGAFGSPARIAGKTGTTQAHRDAWFVGFNPDLVIAVWVGRDDNSPLPGRTTGSGGAAPIAARILAEASKAGLITQTTSETWPPRLLAAGTVRSEPAQTQGAMVFEPDPDARRRAMEAGADPFKNPQDLFDQLRNRDQGGEREPTNEDAWGDREADPWDARPMDPYEVFNSN